MWIDGDKRLTWYAVTEKISTKSPKSLIKWPQWKEKVMAILLRDLGTSNLLRDWSFSYPLLDSYSKSLLNRATHVFSLFSI